MIRGGLQDAYAYFAKALSLATCSGPGFTEVLVNLKKRNGTSRRPKNSDSHHRRHQWDAAYARDGSENIRPLLRAAQKIVQALLLLLMAYLNSWDMTSM